MCTYRYQGLLNSPLVLWRGSEAEAVIAGETHFESRSSFPALVDEVDTFRSCLPASRSGLSDRSQDSRRSRRRHSPDSWPLSGQPANGTECSKLANISNGDHEDR